MPLEQLSRTQSRAIALMKQRLGGFETEAGRLSGLGFSPVKASDVFITTSPKAGTTVMQQIVHQLRTGGHEDFEEISQVVPWLELAADQGQDLQQPQYAEPRAFKTHAWRPHCPEGGRYIVMVREPADVLYSFYKFFEGWFFEPGTLPLEAFAAEFWLARGVPASRMQNASYWDHFLSWYEVRNDPNVLFLFYEDLLTDRARLVQRVASFIGVTDPAAIQIATERSSLEYMKSHGSLFDEKLSKRSRNEACGLPVDAGMGCASKVRAGVSGGGAAAIDAETLSAIEARWQTQMLPATGHASYAALRAACAAESAGR